MISACSHSYSQFVHTVTKQTNKDASLKCDCYCFVLFCLFSLNTIRILSVNNNVIIFDDPKKCTSVNYTVFVLKCNFTFTIFTLLVEVLLVSVFVCCRCCCCFFWCCFVCVFLRKSINFEPYLSALALIEKSRLSFSSLNINKLNDSVI